jgi:hypothetical protein
MASYMLMDGRNVESVHPFISCMINNMYGELLKVDSGL